MGLSTVHLRAALERPALPAPMTGPNIGLQPARRSPPWCPPPPLSWWTRLDPTMKLAIISVVVAPVIAVLATWTLP